MNIDRNITHLQVKPDESALFLLVLFLPGRNTSHAFTYLSFSIVAAPMIAHLATACVDSSVSAAGTTR